VSPILRSGAGRPAQAAKTNTPVAKHGVATGNQSMSALKFRARLVREKNVPRQAEWTTRTIATSIRGANGSALIKARGSARNTRVSDVIWQESPGQALHCHSMFVHAWKSNLDKVLCTESSLFHHTHYL